MSPCPTSPSNVRACRFLQLFPTRRTCLRDRILAGNPATPIGRLTGVGPLPTGQERIDAGSDQLVLDANRTHECACQQVRKLLWLWTDDGKQVERARSGCGRAVGVPFDVRASSTTSVWKDVCTFLVHRIRCERFHPTVLHGSMEVHHVNRAALRRIDRRPIHLLLPASLLASLLRHLSQLVSHLVPRELHRMRWSFGRLSLGFPPGGRPPWPSRRNSLAAPSTTFARRVDSIRTHRHRHTWLRDDDQALQRQSEGRKAHLEARRRRGEADVPLDVVNVQEKQRKEVRGSDQVRRRETTNDADDAAGDGQAEASDGKAVQKQSAGELRLQKGASNRGVEVRETYWSTRTRGRC